jgi:Mg-chelatase subunit ChlD
MGFTIRGRSLAGVVVFTLALLGGTMGGLRALAGPAALGPQDAAPAQRGGTSVCEVASTRALSAPEIQLCQSALVTVTVRPECPGTPVHVVMIIDEVYKIGYSEPRDRTAALRSAVQRLELRKHPNTKVGVVWMQDGSAKKKLDLTNEESRILSVLDVPPVSRFDAKVQCFDCGFREAQKVLDKARDAYPKGTDIYEIDVLAPLGVYTAEAIPGILSGSRQAKSKGVTIISTCFAWTHCDPALREAASESRLYLGYDARNRLPVLLQQVVRDSIATFLRELVVEEPLPDGIDVTAGSIMPAPEVVDPPGRTLRWRFTEPIADVYTLTYRVEPLALGIVQLGAGGWVGLRDSRSRWVTSTLATRALTVSVECPLDTPTPEPTPTDTPSPTDTPVPTATTRPTNTPLPTATPTATRRPLVPVYLPVLVKEQCRDRRTHVDVALVLDISTSMRDKTGDGQTKLDAAMAGARQFLAGMDLTPDEAGASDRVAVVGFNREAWIAAPLTRDLARLEAALDGLPAGMQEHTRLDLAFQRGAEALAEPRAADTTAILVLLTDGLPNRVPAAEDGRPETTVLRAAQAAKDAGVLVYTIGVGRADGPQPEINPALLREAASRPDMFYPAREAGQLGAVYSQLTRVVPCGGTTFWTGRP